MSKKEYKEERFELLLEESKQSIISSIISPFGLAKILFEDKDGGKVNTIHNVRQGIFATEEESAKFEKRGEYDSDKYHKHQNYKDKNSEISELKKQGNLVDSYTGEKVKPNDRIDQDHTISAKEIHDDPGRILAEIKGEDLANLSSNLNPTNHSINRSKKAENMPDYIKKREELNPQEQERIKELSEKKILSDKEENELNKLTNLQKLNPELAKEKDKIARNENNSKVNSDYYCSRKFIGNTLFNGATDGLKMGAQQAVGLIIYEITKGLYHEIKDIWKNGLENTEDIFEDLKNRSEKILNGVISKTEQIIQSFKDGALSGFISSLITTIINTIFTTGKNLVKIIREGFLGLLKAIKLILFTPEQMTKEEATKEGMKILTASVFIGLGVLIDESLRFTLLSSPFAPFADLISSVVVGIITGILTALAVYIIDMIFLEMSMPFSLEMINQIENNIQIQAEILGEIEKSAELYLDIKAGYNRSININEKIINYKSLQIACNQTEITENKEFVKRSSEQIENLKTELENITKAK